MPNVQKLLILKNKLNYILSQRSTYRLFNYIYITILTKCPGPPIIYFILIKIQKSERKNFDPNVKTSI